ncbi:uncharacterized protein LOC125058629 [Pieris napi]|uniref:uncharacterized protein LOC125058629 n=1 Tax=Pieris napi TaxID=78633 RepID=UPI001FBBEF8C|nr:uncharacterized protein LOC125058629 [Pieris napi]
MHAWALLDNKHFATGTKLSPHGAHKRTLHSFPRSPNFNHIVQKYEGPKCKLNLNQKLTGADTVAVYKDTVSCSSTFSLQSLDSFPKYHMRTRSLPRKLKNEFTSVYRTRSHGAFVNSYMNNPEPEHFHIPKCDSCGSINNTYAWEMRKIDPRYKQYGSLYYSIDNLANGLEEDNIDSKPNITKTCDEVPRLDLKCEEEFVESQEFNEDNYFDDVTNCLSQNHIETTEVQRTEDAKTEGIFRAEYVTVQTQTDFSYNTLDSEGEYHSFTDDMLEDIDAVVYESPVKNLVDKDIRDYSVPINFYCEEYGKKDSPRVSPLKKKEAPKNNVLEPILEESKSYEESTSDSNKTQHSETDLTDPKIVPKNEEIDTHYFFDDFKRPKEPPKRETLLQNDARSSCGMSTISLTSFDSTAEFEKLEAVTEVIDLILGKINFDFYRDENLFAKSIQDTNNEPNELFSITDIISDIENNVLDYTPVDISDSFITDSLKVAEAVLYYIFNRAICSSHSRKSKQITKTVITIVDVEDILLTTSREWMGIFHDFTFIERDVIEDKRDTNKGIKQFDNKSEEVHIVLDISHGVPLYLDNIGSNTSDSNEDLPFYGNDSDVPDCPPDAKPKSENNENSDNDEFNLNFNHNFEESSDTICDLLEKSIPTTPHLKEDVNETFVIQDKMNEAFVDSRFSHSSTPQRVVFECPESPINASRYERDDSILSPFLKKTQVHSMSQTEHRGGIKYWVSFSDDIIETERDGRSLKKFNDDSIPSYYVVDFEEKDNGEVLERNNFSNETFSKYESCESEIVEGKLIYDLREKRRMATSWPPSDESLFYRILSNFRMSQSFELSDLNYSKFENSL